MLGTVEPVLVRGAQDMEVDLTGSAAEITVVVLHPLLLLIKRMDTHRPVLKDREEVRVFGRVWPQGVSARISITEPHNPASSLNQQLGIGKGQRWQGHPGGSVNLNHNRRLHLDGHRPRGSMMIEVKVPRTWVRCEPVPDTVARMFGRYLASLLLCWEMDCGGIGKNCGERSESSP